MEEGKCISKSVIFFWCCFSFLVGVAGASILEIPKIEDIYVIGAISTPIFFFITFWKEKKTRTIALIILFFILGIWRYSAAVSTIVSAELPKEKQEIEVSIVKEPDVRQDSVKYVGEIESAELKGEYIYFSTELYPRYQYGDTLSLSCTIKMPEAFDSFRYDMYLASKNIFLTCTRPTILEVHTATTNRFFRTLYVFKQYIAQTIQRLWPEPYASFMSGLLYGYRGGLGTLNDTFSRTGVTHIIAISGYNISIIATILLSLLISLRIKRQYAFWVIVVAIIIFVLFVGANASVVRAGIMGVLVLVARQMGRSAHLRNILILTAATMVLVNPYILLWDVGFQLSFIATMGLIYLAPKIEPYCQRIPKILGIRESVVATFSATISTLPLIMFQFGQVSVVSPIVNILILPIIPFIMSVGALATVAAIVYLPVGTYIAYIAWGAMRYVIAVVEWFGSFSFAAISVEISLIFVCISYAILGLYMYRSTKSTVNKKETEL